MNVCEWENGKMVLQEKKKKKIKNISNKLWVFYQQIFLSWFSGPCDTGSS